MIILKTVTEALAFLDSFDGYGMVSTDESEQVARLRQLDLEDDYVDEEDEFEGLETPETGNGDFIC